MDSPRNASTERQTCTAISWKRSSRSAWVKAWAWTTLKRIPLCAGQPLAEDPVPLFIQHGVLRLERECARVQFDADLDALDLGDRASGHLVGLHVPVGYTHPLTAR